MTMSAPLLSLLLAGSPLPTVATEACAARVSAVRRIERAWLDAYEKHDPRAMRAILAEGFTITHPNGSMQSKRDVVEALGRSSDGRTDTYRTEDVRGRCYGNTVILVGLVVESDGDRSRYTDTYVRLGGRWQVVASHLSRIGKAQAR